MSEQRRKQFAEGTLSLTQDDFNRAENLRRMTAEIYRRGKASNEDMGQLCTMVFQLTQSIQGARALVNDPSRKPEYHAWAQRKVWPTIARLWGLPGFQNAYISSPEGKATSALIELETAPHDWR